MAPTTSNKGVPVRRTSAIGPRPCSTTPPQLSDALWNWSGSMDALEGDSPTGLPIKEGRGVGQTWLLSAEKPPPALELTLPSGKAFLRAEMTVPRRARTDVWDKIKQQRGPATSRGRGSRTTNSNAFPVNSYALRRSLLTSLPVFVSVCVSGCVYV